MSSEKRAGNLIDADSMASQYREEITSPSFTELRSLAFWAKMKGPEFYLIGGWAAWRLHGGLGSRDIDVVFPDEAILDMFLTQYYKVNGYEQYGGFASRRYRKRVIVRSEPVFVYIDAASFDDSPPFKGNADANLPFALLKEHSVVWDLGDATVRIPIPELLLLQKVKAFLDRNWDLDHLAIGPVDSAYLRSKIQKDTYDIHGIANVISDWELVRAIAETNGCWEIVETAFLRMGLR